METVVTTGSAATLASVCVSLVKFGFPSLPSWAILLASLVSGIASATLVALAQGNALTMQSVAISAITGIFAAATAAGISRADRAADERRTAAQLGAYE